jgi:threonine dehydrogenase-like Zn-dependent dehydrogenase
VVDPATRSPWEAWREVAWGDPEEVHDRMALAGRPTQVVYEMVGHDGMLGDIVEHCEIGARVLSCGGAAQDTIATTTAHMKGLNLQIGGAPELEDWFGCLDAIVAGEIDPTPLHGETVGLEGLADAIERARSPEAPVRIVWTPDAA